MIEGPWLIKPFYMLCLWCQVYNCLSISIDADSRLAYAYSLQKISMTYVQSNQPIGTVYRQVDCYHRVGGKWLIVYQQLSAPFDPVTGKAVLNAGP